MSNQTIILMKKNLQILFLFLLALIQGTNMQAQNNPNIKRTMHWYFGYGAGLDFSSGSPVVDTTGKSAGPEDCFTMSDTCGNLLFYGAEDSTNCKLIIWTKNHTVMQNGILTSCLNPTQTVCVPQPGNDSLFYVFYPHFGGCVNGKLLYAIINLNHNNGLGEIVSSDNVLIDSLSTEKVAATLHCNGTDYWIAGKDRGNWLPTGNQLRVWLLTANGLNTTPVVSTPGNIGWENGDGYFRFSPDGSMSAVAYVNQTSIFQDDSSYVEVYKFDNCTGIFTDPITIQFPQAYGLCFSPDNSKLYVGCCDGIFCGEVDTAYIKQYDLSNYNLSSVLASAVILKQGAIGNHFQIGLDGKIYVAGFDTLLQNYGSDRLGVIQNPNLQGFACNYNAGQINLLNAPSLPIGYSAEGLPYYPDSYFNSFYFSPCEPNNIDTFNELAKINIYPNPANDYIIIKNNEYSDYSIKIYDILGNLLNERAIKTDERIDISSFLSGIYLIQLYISNFQFINLKFVKS